MSPLPVPADRTQLPWLPHSSCSQFVGLNPSTLIMETGQDFPRCCWVPTCSQSRGRVLRGAASHVLKHEPLYGLSNWEHRQRGALGCGVDTDSALGLSGHSSVITAELSPPPQVVPGTCRVHKGGKKSVFHLLIQALIPPQTPAPLHPLSWMGLRQKPLLPQHQPHH